MAAVSLDRRRSGAHEFGAERPRCAVAHPELPGWSPRWCRRCRAWESAAGRSFQQRDSGGRTVITRTPDLPHAGTAGGGEYGGRPRGTAPRGRRRPIRQRADGVHWSARRDLRRGPRGETEITASAYGWPPATRTRRRSRTVGPEVRDGRLLWAVCRTVHEHVDVDAPCAPRRRDEDGDQGPPRRPPSNFVQTAGAR